MKRLKLDHCVLHVSDWERSNAFYRDVLEAEILPGGAGWVYRFGDWQLNLHGPGLEPDPVARVPVAPGGSDLCSSGTGRLRRRSRTWKPMGCQPSWDRYRVPGRAAGA